MFVVATICGVAGAASPDLPTAQLQFVKKGGGVSARCLLENRSAHLLVVGTTPCMSWEFNEPGHHGFGGTGSSQLHYELFCLLLPTAKSADGHISDTAVRLREFDLSHYDLIRSFDPAFTTTVTVHLGVAILFTDPDTRRLTIGTVSYQATLSTVEIWDKWHKLSPSGVRGQTKVSGTVSRQQDGMQGCQEPFPGKEDETNGS
jgi:hypothetical protein